MAEDVDAVMQSIPAEWRIRWCAEAYEGGCACMGCVEVGNRLIMTGLKATQVDPEHIDERKITLEVYRKYKVTKPEWEEWLARQMR